MILYIYNVIVRFIIYTMDKKIKRIGMIIEAWEPMWGGGQEVAKQLSIYFAKLGIEVDLYVMNLSINSIKYNEFNLIQVGKKRKWNFKDRILWMFNFIFEFKKNHSLKKYDLIYAHANLPGVPCKYLSKKLNIPCVYQVHGSGLDSMKQMYGDGLMSKILYFIENFVQTKIKYDLQFSVDNKFIKLKNINDTKFIANGVDINKFENKLNILKEEDLLNFIFVGRLHPQKGLIYLIEAVNLIKDKLEGKNIIFTIVGEGDEKFKLVDMIKIYGVEKYFNFVGRKYGEILVEEFLRSDVFILPSIFEGFPLTILEAWAAKLPVLVTEVGENPSVVKEGINGWLVKSKSFEELGNKILSVVELDKNDLVNIGLNGYNLTKNKYSWEIISKEIVEELEKLLK